jgi:hypothetical protein
MDNEPQRREPAEPQAEVFDFQAAQAKKLAETMTPEVAKVRLDALAAQYRLPRAEDGVHMALDVLRDPSGERIDPEVLRQIMLAEEAYDAVAGPSDESPADTTPPAVGE